MTHLWCIQNVASKNHLVIGRAQPLLQNENEKKEKSKKTKQKGILEPSSCARFDTAAAVEYTQYGGPGRYKSANWACPLTTSRLIGISMNCQRRILIAIRAANFIWVLWFPLGHSLLALLFSSYLASHSTPAPLNLAIAHGLPNSQSHNRPP